MERWMKCIILAVVLCVLLLIVGLAVGLTLPRDSNPIQATFMERCEQFKDYNCGNLWEAFQQAFVNKDPCKVPMEAYDPLMAAAPFKIASDRMLFWSSTKDVAHHISKKRKDCFITLEDTVLGYTLDGLTWCGKEGSNEIITNCSQDCVNNPFRSFWDRVSAAFADAASGKVTAMLNGSISTPFNSSSTFARIEVKRLNPTRVNTLNVVLVTQDKPVSGCTDASLVKLQNELAKGIRYNCKEVQQSQINVCASNPQTPCNACW